MLTASACVIIVNWNGRHHLSRCLPSLRAQTYRDFETIVVDNGSTDESIAWLKKNYPAIRLIRNTENIGFAAANNQAIQATNNPYVVTLNNDTVATPTWLAELVLAIESDDSVGMVASQILLNDRPQVIDSAGIEVDWTGTAWQRRRGESADGNDIWQEVFGPCAAAALYRRAMLDDIGLFDEDFFVYYEDVDLAWRAQNAGWRCLYAPRAQVYHAHSATGGQDPSHKWYFIGRNKVWTLIKNYPTARLLVTWPLVLGFEFTAMLYALMIKHSAAPLRGRLDGWLAISSAWRKRRTVRREVWGKLAPLRNPLRAGVEL